MNSGRMIIAAMFALNQSAIPYHKGHGEHEGSHAEGGEEEGSH
jgi:hypothetical protein